MHENWGGRTGGRSGREGREAPASLPKEASLRVLFTMRPARLLSEMRRAIASLRVLFTMRPARLLCVMRRAIASLRVLFTMCPARLLCSCDMQAEPAAGPASGPSQTLARESERVCVI